MRFIADLQLHSRFSGATSDKMRVDEISYYAQLKGLNLLGTGDALHPTWLAELEESLEELEGSGLYVSRSGEYRGIFFIVQTEVATVHELSGKARRIHHVILMPSFEIAHQLRDLLKPYGNIDADGRPVLEITPAELVEIVMATSRDNLVFPAHAWTPWWSIFGAFSGVDRVEECYEDQTKHIHAIETGLSSDPPMNYRCSWLDRYVLLSSSDAHSPYPYRIGREAVVFELPRPSYRELIDAVRKRDKSRIKMTVEVPPEYGKYHWSGHRRCSFGPVSPSEARKLGYKCPVCGRKLTKGVDDRVEELADREPGYTPPDAIGFIRLLPLQELIAVSLGMGPEAEAKLMSQKVWKQYLKLIEAFGNEFNILLDASIESIREQAGPRLAELIAAMREDRLRFTPGYDGVYGRLMLEGGGKSESGRASGTLDRYY